jgi:hypothetical protein
MVKLLSISKTLCTVSNYFQKMYIPYIKDRPRLFASIYLVFYSYKSQVIRCYLNYVQGQCGHAYRMRRYVCTWFIFTSNKNSTHLIVLLSN